VSTFQVRRRGWCKKWRLFSRVSNSISIYSTYNVSADVLWCQWRRRCCIGLSPSGSLQPDDRWWGRGKGSPYITSIVGLPKSMLCGGFQMTKGHLRPTRIKSPPSVLPHMALGIPYIGLLSLRMDSFVRVGDTYSMSRAYWQIWKSLIGILFIWGLHCIRYVSIS
jgi:hypothetical protein